MKPYSLVIIIFTCCICRYMSVKIMLKLKKNILKFGYRINFKYIGMLAHSFDRFYVVTKFILPTVNDIKFLPININEICDYLQEKMDAIKMLKNIFLILGFIAKILFLLSIITWNKYPHLIAQPILY